MERLDCTTFNSRRQQHHRERLLPSIPPSNLQQIIRGVNCSCAFPRPLADKKGATVPRSHPQPCTVLGCIACATQGMSSKLVGLFAVLMGAWAGARGASKLAEGTTFVSFDAVARSGETLGNRSDHINPTHYGSPLDCSTCSPPINCKLDEDGLIIDSFIWNPVTGKMEQSLLMWCAPNLTRAGATACPTDIPAGAATPGAKPIVTSDVTSGDSRSCLLSCVQHSDCGGKALCANETKSFNTSMCGWVLE